MRVMQGLMVPLNTALVEPVIVQVTLEEKDD